VLHWRKNRRHECRNGKTLVLNPGGRNGVAERLWAMPAAAKPLSRLFTPNTPARLCDIEAISKTLDDQSRDVITTKVNEGRITYGGTRTEGQQFAGALYRGGPVGLGRRQRPAVAIQVTALMAKKISVKELFHETTVDA
jgi:hypothetical protein